MKKIITLSLLLFNLMVNAQFTLIPDANFENELINLGYDTTVDGQVLTANISSVTNLDVSGKSISDLTGIQDFTSLISLRCQNNLLTSLDTSGLLSLEEIWCFDNNLTNLNVSTNTSLLNLFCNNNSLTSLDVSANNALQQLDCSFNQIDTIDLSNAPGIFYIWVRNNSLTSLNVQNGNNTDVTFYNSINNLALTCIQVDDASYSATNWTNVDNPTVFNTNCHYFETFVPDNNFEQALINLGYDTTLDDYVLTANINTLTTLDVSIQNIVDLTGIEDFEALQNLNCARNQLTSLNLSANTNLQVVNCNRNQLTQLSITDGSGSSQNNLIELYCGDNQLGGTLPTNFYPNLQILSCPNNNITNLNALFSNADLQTLTCNNNLITSLVLNNNPVLTSLDVRNNSLSDLFVVNGNNTNFTTFNTLNNTNLACIEVDDAAWSTTNWTDIDPTTVFSENCAALSNPDISAKEEILVFPNPTTTILNIPEFAQKAIIYNTYGQKVLETESQKIQMQNITAGVYFVEILSNTNSYITRIVKK